MVNWLQKKIIMVIGNGGAKILSFLLAWKRCRGTISQPGTIYSTQGRVSVTHPQHPEVCLIVLLGVS